MNTKVRGTNIVFVVLGIVGLMIYAFLFAEVIHPVSIWIDVTLLVLLASLATFYLLKRSKKSIRAIALAVLSVISLVATISTGIQDSGHGADIGSGMVAIVSSILAYLVAVTFVVPDHQA